MSLIRFDGQSYERNADESVLELLERHGHEVPNSCRAGLCQSCLMQAVEGDPNPESQAGLKETWKQQGMFLACQCKPKGDLNITRADEVQAALPARVVGLSALSKDVLQVQLESPQLEFRPGQFINVIRDDGLQRSYSLANLQDGEPLTLHVRHIPGGAMSAWMHDDLQLGVDLEIQGPMGSCFYIDGKPEQDLLLVGTGTGLAPLYGIARDALMQKHSGQIILYHGGLTPEGLYLMDELRALDEAHENFHYRPVVMRDGADQGMPEGHVADVVLSDLPKLKGWRSFLCGDPALVRQLQRKIYLAGADLAEIHIDAFEPSGQTKAA